MKVTIHKDLEASDATAPPAVVSVPKKTFRHSRVYKFAKRNAVALIVAALALLALGSSTYFNYQTTKKLAVLEAALLKGGTGSAVAAALKALPQKELPPDPVTIPLSNSARVLGDPNAPVTVIEFADYQCPYCGKFFKNVYPELKEKYIDTGKVKFVYQDFSFLGKESDYAAEAAKCAGDQNKFWQYHDYLYSHQDGENRGTFSIENLKKFALTLQLNKTQFDACLDSKKYTQVVDDETALGSSLQITGTPTVFVNGYRFIGSQPFAALETRIKTELAK